MTNQTYNQIGHQLKGEQLSQEYVSKQMGLHRTLGIPPVYINIERKKEYLKALRFVDETGDFAKLQEVFYKAVVSSCVELSHFPVLE